MTREGLQMYAFASMREAIQNSAPEVHLRGKTARTGLEANRGRHSGC